jgi:hypothetical protein
MLTSSGIKMNTRKEKYAIPLLRLEFSRPPQDPACPPPGFHRSLAASQTHNWVSNCRVSTGFDA